METCVYSDSDHQTISIFLGRDKDLGVFLRKLDEN